MKDYFKKRPMLTGAILISIVCILGYYFKSVIFITGIACIISFFIMLYKHVNLKYIVIVFLLFITGIRVLIVLNTISQVTKVSGVTQNGTFIVTEDPKNYDNYSFVTAETVNCKVIPKGTKLKVFYSNTSLKCGDFFSGTVKFKAIDSKYRISDFSNNIYISANISKISVDKTNEDFVLSGIGNVRKYVRNSLTKYLNTEEASTLIALVTGNRSFLSDEFYSNIKNAGVSHVMVVSGMHLAVIVALVTAISELLFYNRFIKAGVVFLTVLFMMTLCGFTMSIIRAGFSYLLYAISLLLQRKNSPENTLGTAVSLMLIISPFSVFNISFQLSVLSTLGIVAVALPVIRYLENSKLKMRKILFSVITAVIISVSALLFTMPVVISVFGYIAVFSVITNLLISFAVTVVLSLVSVALALNLFSSVIAAPLFAVCGLITKYINSIINYIGELPFATIETGNLSFLISIIAIIVVVTCLFACKKSNYMLRLKKMQKKIIREGGGKLKWQ